MNIASIAARLKGAFGFVTAEQSVTGGIKYSIAGGQVTKDGRGAAAVGDSLILGAVQGASPYNWAIRKSKKCRNIGNFAVAGTRTDEIMEQLSSANEASVIVGGGGVNDILQSVSESTLRSNWIDNVRTARSSGSRFIDVGLPPTNTTGNVPRYVQHEVWRKLFCYKNDIQHVDAFEVLATPTGAYKTGKYLDAVHYNSVGAADVAGPLLAQMEDNLLSCHPLLAMTDTNTDAGSFVANAVSFTDTNADGLPDGWFNGGATTSITAEGGADRGAWLRCTLAGGVNQGVNPTTVTLASLGWSVGDKIAVGFRLRWQDVAGALAIYCYYQGIGIGGTQPLHAETGGATGGDIYVYKESVITSGTTIGIKWYATGTGWFEINRPIVVNLTKLGLS